MDKLTPKMERFLLEIAKGCKKVLNANTTWALEERGLIDRHLPTVSHYPQTLTKKGIEAALEIYLKRLEKSQLEASDYIAYGSKWPEESVVYWKGNFFRIKKNLGESGLVEYANGRKFDGEIVWLFSTPVVFVTPPNLEFDINKYQ